MPVKNRDQVGWIQCPICDTRATAHRCLIGRGGRVDAHYWRCECGTVQPWKPAGQRFIAANIEPMETATKTEPPPPPETAPKEEQTEPEFTPTDNRQTKSTETPKKPAKRGFMAMLLEED
jgi:hypothetical protein